MIGFSDSRTLGREEAIEYFRREPQGSVSEPDPFFVPPVTPEIYLLPRPGTWIPNPVDKEDQKEEFRLILEYCFYMPPTGQRFDRDWYRSHLMGAILSIGHPDRSMIVMSSDAEMALSAETRQEANHEILGNEHEPLYFMANSPTERSFSTLSKLWVDRSSQITIQAVFAEMWKERFVEDKYQVAKKTFDAWQAMARKEWETREEQELSKWIRSLAPPRKFDSPKSRVGSSSADDLPE